MVYVESSGFSHALLTHHMPYTREWGSLSLHPQFPPLPPGSLLVLVFLLGIRVKVRSNEYE